MWGFGRRPALHRRWPIGLQADILGLEQVFRQLNVDGPWPAAGRKGEGPREHFGDLLRPFHTNRPFCDVFEDTIQEILTVNAVERSVLRAAGNPA